MSIIRKNKSSFWTWLFTRTPSSFLFLWVSCKTIISKWKPISMKINSTFVSFYGSKFKDKIKRMKIQLKMVSGYFLSIFCLFLSIFREFSVIFQVYFRSIFRLFSINFQYIFWSVFSLFSVYFRSIFSLFSVYFQSISSILLACLYFFLFPNF